MEAPESEPATAVVPDQEALDFSTLFPVSRARLLSGALSQKACLRQASELIAADCENLNPRDVLTHLLDRERLGSTAMDDSGIAIPHCRLDGCGEPMGALLHTTSAVSFGDELADMFFVLVVPDNDADNRLYLQILGAIAEVYGENEKSNTDELRAAKSDEELSSTFLRHMTEFLAG